MNTYRISEKEIKDMQPVAVGYKMFNNGFTTKHGDYDYKDENGNVVGTIHKVDGEISECNRGLHFSKLPHECFSFYEPLQWNKFAKVEAYGELIEGDKKCVTSILKIVEVYSFDEFIDLCKEELQKVNTVGGYDIHGGSGIRGGYDIHGGYDIRGSSYIRGGYGIRGGYDIRGGYGICGGYGIWGGSDIHGGYDIRGSSYIRGGYGIWGGSGIRGGYDIHGGYDIRGSSYIRGGYGIWGGSGIWGAYKCEGISRCIFCYNTTGKLMAFNNPISPSRFEQLWQELNDFNWYPKFNNAEQLKGNLEWYEANIPAIVGVDRKTAWSSIPQEMKEYIQNLPEYDEKIFNIVTGIAEEEEDER